MTATVFHAGFLTSVQDLGRTGYRQFGVSLAGALDVFALRVANLLVGNDESAAGLEITFGGLRLQVADERIVAWCGGEFDVQIGSRSLPAGHAARLQAREELKFGRPQLGCRAWLAVAGGVDVRVVLGSRSTDLRANFGGFEGRTLRDGEAMPLGKWTGSPTPATYYFLVDCAARLGKSADARSDFAFRSRHGLGPLQRFNASTLHERSIRRLQRFGSHGRAPRWSRAKTG